MQVRIGDRMVGDEQPVFIVAEAGSNHDGRLEQAKALIDVAADAGADAVKFQLFSAVELYPRGAGTSDYLGNSRSIFEIIKDVELPQDWLPELAARSAERGLIFLVTPFDERSVDLIDAFVPAYKIASYEMTHEPLLRHVASKRKPMIVSTGGANADEVEHTVGLLRAAGVDDLIVMQCTASYPAPLESLDLRSIRMMRDRLAVLVGLSDHSREPTTAPLLAVALGACVIEKHFTLDNDLPGPDHRYAVEPGELRQLVRALREAESALGRGTKEVQAVELELRSFARRTIFARRAIAKGELLNVENVAVLRAGKLGHGLDPSEYPALLGRRARQAIPTDRPILPDDLA